MELLVVGSVALDTVETPLARREEVLGGSASYFSAAACRFAPVSLVAVVGQDFPASYRTLLAERGVDISGLQTAAGRTFRWSGRYHANMNQRDTLSTELGVFESFAPLLPERVRRSGALFLGNIHPALQLQVLDQVEGVRFVGLDTMNYWIAGTPELLAQVLARVDLLLINEEEARALTGRYSLLAAARTILGRGPRYLVVKRGEYGALLFWQDGVFCVPALLLEQVCDPTGAGDSFAGGFMGFLAQQEDLGPLGLRRAMIHGTVMASFAVEDFSLDGLLQPDAPAIAARGQALLALMQLG
ncbi:MAG: sugar kinase [Deltaproteobacteria bacterium]|nr:sugar kinase [Deltaproteobacteria bacterium]